MSLASIARALPFLVVAAGSTDARAVQHCPTVELFPLSGGAGDLFGQAVAADDRDLFVGAPRAGAGSPGPGAVGVYERAPHGWQEVDVLLPDPGEGGDFGRAVDVWRDRAVIGSPEHGGLGPESGAAYVYERENGEWLLAQKLVGSDTKAGDGFGSSVAVFGNTIVVGAPEHGNGAAYVFEKVAGTWIESDLLSGGLGFGQTVAMVEARLVIGSESTAELFELAGGRWALTHLFSCDGFAHCPDILDIAISGDGGTVAVGSKSEAHVFVQDAAGGWPPPTEFVLELFVATPTVRVALRDDGSGFYLATTSSFIAADNLVQTYEYVGGEWELAGEFAPGVISFGTSIDWTAGSIVGGAPRASLHGFQSGAVFVDEDVFETYGAPLPGVAGIEPRLSLMGCPAPSGQVSITVLLALADAPGFLLVGLEKAEIPLGDASLWVTPIVATIGFTVGPGTPFLGSVEIPLAVPSLPGLQGLSATLQSLHVDPDAPAGVASTAGYRMWIR